MRIPRRLPPSLAAVALALAQALAAPAAPAQTPPPIVAAPPTVAAPPGPAAPPPPPAVTEPRSPVSTGFGLAALAAGGLLGLSSLTAALAGNRTCNYDTATRVYGCQRHDGPAIALGVSGAGLLALGIPLLVHGARRVPARPALPSLDALQVELRPGAASLRIIARF